MAALDSARQIGLNALSKEVLIADEGSAGGDLKLAKFGTFLITVRERIEMRTKGWYH